MKITIQAFPGLVPTATGRPIEYTIHGLTSRELGDILAFLDMYQSGVEDHVIRARGLADAISQALKEATF